MYMKTCAALVLATGFAAAKPINAPETLPAYGKRSAPMTPVKRANDIFGNGFNGDFDIFNQFGQFNNQQQVLQFQQQDVQFIDNGAFGQQFVQQAQEVLIIDQQNNGFNNKFNDLARAASFRNQFPQQETVMLVVQQIDVAIDDGRGNQIQQSVFAQSAVVANQGAFGGTQTVMVFASTAVVAQNVFNQFGNVGGFNLNNGIAVPTGGFPQGNGNAFGSGGVALPTATNNVQFFGAKPTWSQVAEDPANTAAAAWQAELQAAQNQDIVNAGNNANNDAANKINEAAKQQQDQQQQDQQQQDQQKEDQQKEGEKQ